MSAKGKFFDVEDFTLFRIFNNSIERSSREPVASPGISPEEFASKRGLFVDRLAEQTVLQLASGACAVTKDIPDTSIPLKGLMRVDGDSLVDIKSLISAFDSVSKKITDGEVSHVIWDMTGIQYIEEKTLDVILALGKKVRLTNPDCTMEIRFLASGISDELTDIAIQLGMKQSAFVLFDEESVMWNIGMVIGQLQRGAQIELVAVVDPKSGLDKVLNTQKVSNTRYVLDTCRDSDVEEVSENLMGIFKKWRDDTTGSAAPFEEHLMSILLDVRTPSIIPYTMVAEVVKGKLKITPEELRARQRSSKCSACPLNYICDGDTGRNFYGLFEDSLSKRAYCLLLRLLMSQQYKELTEFEYGNFNGNKQFVNFCIGVGFRPPEVIAKSLDSVDRVIAKSASRGDGRQGKKPKMKLEFKLPADMPSSSHYANASEGHDRTRPVNPYASIDELRNNESASSNPYPSASQVERN